MMKIFFADDIEWTSKNLWKNDIGIASYLLMQKLIKTRNKRSGGSSYLKIFYKTYLQNLKYKKEHVFFIWFWLVWYFKHDESCLSAVPKQEVWWTCFVNAPLSPSAEWVVW